MDLNAHIGKSVGPYDHLASVEALAGFASAVGAPARAEGLPSFLTVCRRGEFDLVSQLGIPLSRILHGEQEYVFEAPLQAGQKLQYSTTLASVIEKRGGSSPMQLLVFESRITADGTAIGVSRTTFVYRGGQ